MAQYLLEAGAVCNEYTFDGDRCHYASLTGMLASSLPLLRTPACCRKVCFCAWLGLSVLSYGTTEAPSFQEAGRQHWSKRRAT